jgi:hypothetical protein
MASGMSNLGKAAAGPATSAKPKPHWFFYLNRDYAAVLDTAGQKKLLPHSPSLSQKVFLFFGKHNSTLQ